MYMYSTNIFPVNTHHAKFEQAVLTCALTASRANIHMAQCCPQIEPSSLDITTTIQHPHIQSTSTIWK